MNDDRIRFSIRKRWLRQLVLAAATLAIAVPTTAWASHQFDDVPDGAYHAEIEWLADNGITVGCNDDGSEFCPNEFVRRKQMAAFLYRLETRGVFLPADGKAADADELDGMDSSEFLPRFLVINYNLGTASEVSSRGITWTRESAGRYLLETDVDNVRDCAWTGAVGQRNNSTYGGSSFATIALHSVAGATDSIRVQINDQNGTDDDASFNVAVHC